MALYLHCLVRSKLLLSYKPKEECICCGNYDLPELMNLIQLFSLICLFNILGSRGPYDPSGKLKLLKLICLAFSVKTVLSLSYCSFSYRLKLNSKANKILNGVCSVWLVGWFLTKHRNLKMTNQYHLIKNLKRKHINEPMESGSFSDSYNQNSSSFTPQTHRHTHDFFLMCSVRSFTYIYRRDCVGNFKRDKLQLGAKFSQAMEDFPCVING